MKTGIGAVLLALTACVGTPPAEIADREYRDQDRRIKVAEDFERRQAMCARAGGTFQIKRYSSGRQSLTTDEMRMATCQ